MRSYENEVCKVSTVCTKYMYMSTIQVPGWAGCAGRDIPTSDRVTSSQGNNSAYKQTGLSGSFLGDEVHGQMGFNVP